MMGRLNHDQGRLFYSFCLEEAVPEDHLVREVAAVLDLSWVHAELAPHYPDNGRPSIDPELMIRMLIIGYVFAIRSERALCRDVQVNLAYPVGSADFQSRTRSLIILRSRAPTMSGSVTVTFSAVSSSMSWKRALQQDWSAAKGLRSHGTGSMWVGRRLRSASPYKQPACAWFELVLYLPRKIRLTSGLLIRLGASPSIVRRPLSRI
jgi:Transposase domain (DUF772)